MHPAISQLNLCSYKNSTNMLSTAALTKMFSTKMRFLITLPKIFRQRCKSFQRNSLKLWKLFVMGTMVWTFLI